MGSNDMKNTKKKTEKHTKMRKNTKKTGKNKKNKKVFFFHLTGGLGGHFAQVCSPLLYPGNNIAYSSGSSS